ncbi:MAG: hypothetical protein P1Q69_11195 [Candidatus Thorarchaeota archaeon]|nr:hypothetical protein [Candidatus Thorarchaeota archaeon]
MSMKNASLKTLKEDLLVSFKFASRNVITFILAMFGVVIVTVLIIALAAVVVIPIFFLAVGLEGLFQIFTSWITTFDTTSSAALVLLILSIMTPILAPFLVAVGALYGMGREIVESDGTTAEGVFAWYRKKFFSLAGGGLIQFLLAITPIIVGVIILPFYGLGMGFGPDNLGLASVVVALLLIYVGVVTGLLSMVFPAIIDGHTVFESVKISLRLSTKYFDRVFSVWFAFLGIAGLLFLPIVAIPFLTFSTSVVFSAWFGLYSAAVVIFEALILFPAGIIGMSRIYLILIAETVTNGEEVTEYFDETSNDVGLFGGD